MKPYLRLVQKYWGYADQDIPLCFNCGNDFAVDWRLIYKGAKMIVANSQLEKPIKTTIVPDKFTGNMNKLYYYEWKPIDKRQGDLLV